MAKCVITVLRRDFNKDLAEKYCGVEATPCGKFHDGQVFTLENMDQPAGFCYWAWNDIFPVFLTLMKNGNFQPWMKDEHTIIACCSDGIRPVIFEIKRVD
jgi:uncharacterized repeat protein (TIGR04076 family)